MANIIIGPEKTVLNISGDSQTPITVKPDSSVTEKVSVERQTSNVVSAVTKTVRVEIPALQGLPGPQGETGQGMDLEPASYEFFAAKNLPIRDIHYNGEDIQQIDFLNSDEILVYSQTFSFSESGDLEAITLTRMQDLATFVKSFTYSGGRLIKITITTGV